MLDILHINYYGPKVYMLHIFLLYDIILQKNNVICMESITFKKGEKKGRKKSKLERRIITALQWHFLI